MLSHELSRGSATSTDEESRLKFFTFLYISYCSAGCDSVFQELKVYCRSTIGVSGVSTSFSRVRDFLVSYVLDKSSPASVRYLLAVAGFYDSLLQNRCVLFLFFFFFKAMLV